MHKFELQQKIDNETYLANQLNSINIFSREIAHNFSDILMLIVGNIELARMQIDEPEKTVEILSEAERVCDKAKKLIYQLSILSTDYSAEKTKVSIGEIVKYVVMFCLRGLKIKYEFSGQYQVLYVRGNKGQLYQAFTNLILDTVHAIPEGSTLKINFKNSFIGKNSNIPLNQGYYVRISIKVDGFGILEDKISTFFKHDSASNGNGKGIGLAITKSIIEKHEGYISVESLSGVGTTYHIYLPAYL
jgi:signal transduction histidine kinase